MCWRACVALPSMRSCPQRRLHRSSSSPAWRRWRVACRGGQPLALLSRQVRIIAKHTLIITCHADTATQGGTRGRKKICHCAPQVTEMQQSPMPWQQLRTAVRWTSQQMLQIQRRSSWTSMTMNSQIGASTR